MKCPNCNFESNGSFCPECGTPLTGAKCSSCNAALLPGAKFCTQCGAGAGSRQNASPSILPWLVAGAALLLLAIAIAVPRKPRGSAEDGARVPISDLQAREPSGSAPGPLTGTPREQADRLFNRIMTERENGDSAKAAMFLPMGIQAYEMAGDLDPDGLYHLSLLHALQGDFKASREIAERILANAPNHLLGLSAAASAARAEGESAAARKYDERFLAAYDEEIKTKKLEYEDHSRTMPELRAAAQRHVK